MKPKHLVVVALIVAVLGAGGWWLAQSRSTPHQHQLEKRVDTQGHTYYTCPMHPQVQLDTPGQCPICGMKLVERKDAAAETPAAPADKPVLYWYDPMHPEQHFDAPGKSPFMDMQLVPRYADASQGTLVQISPGAMQALGIRVAAAERGDLSQGVATVGSVALDERRIVTVESRTAGWIEKLEVRAAGDVVKKGQALAWLYSPELFAAQQELKLAQASGDTNLTQASEQRLRLMGGSGGSSRSGVYSPTSGFVVELMAREGAQLSPGMPLMKIADPSQVWLLAEIPESQSGSVRPGDKAHARFASLPGRTFEGRVDYLYPQLDSTTRTLKARLIFDNADEALRAGMFANVTLAGNAKGNVVTIPTEALIRTGRRTVVMVSEGSGRYRPVQVEPGSEHGDRTEILSGLEAGQQVVVSGQFLIDSEASLLGAYERMGGAP